MASRTEPFREAFEAPALALDLDDEPSVLRPSDRLAELVPDLDLEIDARPLDRGHPGRDIHPGIEEGRPEVLELDPDPDGVLAFVQVLEDHVAAGVLDIAQHRRRGIDAQRIAHEVDGALPVDGLAPGAGKSGGERILHCLWVPCSREFRLGVGPRAACDGGVPKPPRFSPPARYDTAIDDTCPSAGRRHPYRTGNREEVRAGTRPASSGHARRRTRVTAGAVLPGQAPSTGIAPASAAMLRAGRFLDGLRAGGPFPSAATRPGHGGGPAPVGNTPSPLAAAGLSIGRARCMLTFPEEVVLLLLDEEDGIFLPVAKSALELAMSGSVLPVRF